MGAVVSTLAFPFPDKGWSQNDLLRRARMNQLVYLTTESGYRQVFRDSLRLFYIDLVNQNAFLFSCSIPTSCSLLAFSFLLSWNFYQNTRRPYSKRPTKVHYYLLPWKCRRRRSVASLFGPFKPVLQLQCLGL
jgi:hypothetical protein